MNYQCEQLQGLIEAYEQAAPTITGEEKILIDRLKSHIAEHGNTYEVVGISKADLEVNGYDTQHVDEAVIAKIAIKIDIGDSIAYAIEYWAEQYGIPKRNNE